MTDYKELVKALRCGNDGKLPCDNKECPYWVDQWHGIGLCNILKKQSDAAAAIEDMAKHITEMHERVTALQIARGELEAEVKRLEPKLGKWIVHTEVKNIYGGICVECPVCGDHFVVLNVSDEKYCRSCGAKMEVQE